MKNTGIKAPNMPTISIIVARTRNNVIGKDNGMPWGRLPNDLKHFRDTTMGHPIIVGRKTYESIGKPLDGRRNIVLTSSNNIEDVETAGSIEEALSRFTKDDEVFIIGGGTIYEQVLPYADKIYMTTIKTTMEGDTFFPVLDKERFRLLDINVSDKDAENKYQCIFSTYARMEQLF